VFLYACQQTVGGEGDKLNPRLLCVWPIFN